MHEPNIDVYLQQVALLIHQEGDRWDADYRVTVGVRETRAPSDASPKATTLASRKPTTELT
jgi:hypothetical protein